MCENDAAVDRYIIKMSEKALHDNRNCPDSGYFARKSGAYQGVIRELAATVPGVREWLVEHMPGKG